MDPRERNWLIFLVVVFVVANTITLSPLIPWQEWLLWSSPEPSQRIPLEYEDYEIHMPPGGIKVREGEYVEFVAVSADVTYGFGVFRKDGTMVFQMQVLPGRENSIIWKFDEPGQYDVRSTEYSGPRHSEMYYADAVQVTQ
jgi:cytochrome c oxidase subunit 2